MTLAEGKPLLNCKRGMTVYIYIEDGREVRKGDVAASAPYCPKGKAPKGARKFASIGPNGYFTSPQVDRENLEVSCTAICRKRTDQDELNRQIKEIKLDFGILLKIATP